MELENESAPRGHATRTHSRISLHLQFSGLSPEATIRCCVRPVVGTHSCARRIHCRAPNVRRLMTTALPLVATIHPARNRTAMSKIKFLRFAEPFCYFCYPQDENIIPYFRVTVLRKMNGSPIGYTETEVLL